MVTNYTWIELQYLQIQHTMIQNTNLCFVRMYLYTVVGNRYTSISKIKDRPHEFTVINSIQILQYTLY